MIEIAKLLALDRRAPRWPHTAGRPRLRNTAQQWQQIIDGWQSLSATYERALQDWITITDAPNDNKWDHATVARLDEIRALAGVPFPGQHRR